MIKLYVYIFIFTLISSILGYGYYLYKENDRLQTENNTLTINLFKEQEKNVKLYNDYNEIMDINNELYKTTKRLKQESIDLNTKLVKLNNRIDKIALKKPQLLGKTLTNATKKVNRCLENISNDKECE